jgi:hypothetical protein
MCGMQVLSVELFASLVYLIIMIIIPSCRSNVHKLQPSGR